MGGMEVWGRADANSSSSNSYFIVGRPDLDDYDDEYVDYDI
jgi:hypothetical protein